MPKTVNVPFTIPDGYEQASEHIVPPNDPDGFYVTQWGALLQGRQIQSWAAVLPVRPIAPEQTWERPAGMKCHWRWMALEDGPETGTFEMILISARPKPVFHDGHFYREAGSGRVVRVPIGVFDCELPPIAGTEPAARIWRIVERGEG